LLALLDPSTPRDSFAKPGMQFAYEVRAGDQVVRLEAPTHDELMKLIETTSNTPRVKG
jgi:hypothetical protein